MARNRGGRPRKTRPWTLDVQTVRVQSCADGTLLIEPAWLTERRIFGMSPVAMPTRRAFARFCEEAINAALATERGS